MAKVSWYKWIKPSQLVIVQDGKAMWSSPKYDNLCRQTSWRFWKRHWCSWDPFPSQSQLLPAVSNAPHCVVGVPRTPHSSDSGVLCKAGPRGNQHVPETIRSLTGSCLLLFLLFLLFFLSHSLGPWVTWLLLYSYQIPVDEENKHHSTFNCHKENDLQKPLFSIF